MPPKRAYTVPNLGAFFLSKICRVFAIIKILFIFVKTVYNEKF